MSMYYDVLILPLSPLPFYWLKLSQYLIKKDDKSWKEISTVKFDRHSKLKFDREIVDLWKQNISIWQSSITTHNTDGDWKYIFQTDHFLLLIT